MTQSTKEIPYKDWIIGHLMENTKSNTFQVARAVDTTDYLVLKSLRLMMLEGLVKKERGKSPAYIWSLTDKAIEAAQ